VRFGSLPRQRAALILAAPVGMAKLPMRSNPMVVEGINRAPVRDTTKDLARQSRNKSSNPYFTTEAQRSQSSEYFLIKNFLLRALRASAVRSLLDRDK